MARLKARFVISKTPYRLSFFGGGTDYPAWYNENPGAVLATSIDKYCYLMCRWLPPFFEYRHNIVWSQIERVNEINEIMHPAVRETLRYMKITNGVEIHHAGDLPARTGVGSSSAFTVGLLNALYKLKGMSMTPKQLALGAIYIEQDLIKENVGAQDQTASAFGGFNRIDFSVKGINVTRIFSANISKLEKHLMLFFTGFSRTASQIAEEQIERVGDNRPRLQTMYEMVGEATKILKSGALIDFGRLLGESWKLKRGLGKKVSTDYIDYIYNSAISAGAIGGKVVGAGGGGFMLFFVEPELQPQVKERLSNLLQVPFRFEKYGSEII